MLKRNSSGHIEGKIKIIISKKISEYNRFEKSLSFMVGLIVQQGNCTFINFIICYSIEIHEFLMYTHTQAALLIAHCPIIRNKRFSYCLAPRVCLISYW